MTSADGFPDRSRASDASMTTLEVAIWTVAAVLFAAGPILIGILHWIGLGVMATTSSVGLLALLEHNSGEFPDA